MLLGDRTPATWAVTFAVDHDIDGPEENAVLVGGLRPWLAGRSVDVEVLDGGATLPVLRY